MHIVAYMTKSNHSLLLMMKYYLAHAYSNSFLIVHPVCPLFCNEERCDEIVIKNSIME